MGFIKANRPWKQEKKIILVEGMDFLYFMLHALTHLDFPEHIVYVESIETISNLPEALSLFAKTREFSSMTDFLLIKDAEESDLKSAQQSVQDAFRRASLPIPQENGVFTTNQTHPNAAYYVISKEECGGNAGTLENLCLNSLHDQESRNLGCSFVIEAARCFMNISDSTTDFSYDQLKQAIIRPHKAQFAASLAIAREKERDCVLSSRGGAFAPYKLGEAARMKAFNWDHPQMRQLLNVLICLKDQP